MGVVWMCSRHLRPVSSGSRLPGILHKMAFVVHIRGAHCRVLLVLGAGVGDLIDVVESRLHVGIRYAANHNFLSFLDTLAVELEPGIGATMAAAELHGGVCAIGAASFGVYELVVDTRPVAVLRSGRNGDLANETGHGQLNVELDQVRKRVELNVSVQRSEC